MVPAPPPPVEAAQVIAFPAELTLKTWLELPIPNLTQLEPL